MLKKKDKKEKSPMENLNKSIENYIFCKLYVYKFKHFMKFTLPSFSIFCHKVLHILLQTQIG
jgi:hypothetical protein